MVLYFRYYGGNVFDVVGFVIFLLVINNGGYVNRFISVWLSFEFCVSFCFLGLFSG